MALLAPFAGAALGGIATGGAGWAISAGWLIGSWLFQKGNDVENQIFDPGAEEMPRFNQALRGATIMVSFGTNRVSSNIMWQKNFTTIRHESTQGGGGGKGGGSGMGSKGGGPSSTQVTYEYKWDMMMHLGMSDVDVSLFGGWLGSERLNGTTLLAIINNSNSGQASFFRSSVDRPQNASLTFDEGFYHGAFATDDVNAANWSHFESQEGLPHRFPYTYYVGFKQLNLGGHAVVPQLSWEIGPGDMNIDFTGGHIDYWDSASGVAGSGGRGPGASVLIGDNGKRYQLDHSGTTSNVFRLRNATDGVTVETRTDATFDADATTLGLDPLSTYIFTSRSGSAVIPNNNLILAWGQDIGSGARSNWAFVLYKVNSAGAVEVVGGYQGRSNTLENIDSDGIIGIFGEGTSSDPLMLMSNSHVGADREYVLIRLPSISEMQGVLIEDGVEPNFETRIHFLETLVSEIKGNFGDHTSHRNFPTGAFGFFLPVATTDMGVVWETKLMFYIGKSDIEWHNDNPAHANGTQTIYDLTGSYPNGGIFSVLIALQSTHNFSVAGSWTDEADNFIDHETEQVVVPFADSGRLYDETTIEDGSDYDPMPQVQHLTTGAAAGATLLVFWKNLAAGSSDRGITNAHSQAQVFLWNPLSQKAERYGKASGAFADTDADWGIGTGDYTMHSLSGYFDETSEEILIGGYVHGGGASNDIFLSTFGDFNIGGGEDVLPPWIIRRILTSEVFGLGLSSSQIDQASYELALQYCDSQNIRVSVQYKREENALRVIDQLLSVYGGYLIDSGGKIKFGLQTFTPAGSVERVIDNDHLRVDGDEAPVSITRGARQDTFNKIKVNYIDRDLEYRQNFVEIADEVDMDLNGVRAQEFPPKFVMTEGTANLIAIRGLWSNLYARDIYDFGLGPKDADLEPGDVVTLVDSHHQTLSNGKQVRIVMWLEPEPLNFNVRAVDEIEYIAGAGLEANSSTTASSNSLFGPALPAAGSTMYELPKEFQGANAQVFVGYRQQSNAKGARLYTSADGVSFAQIQEVQPFIISGIMANGLPLRSPGFVDESIDVYLMPDTATGNWAPSSMTWAQTFQLDDVGPTGRALGAGMLWINSEMMAYEGVNLVGQNHYRFDKLYRGWGGTHIQGHSSGDTWHKHGGGIFLQAYNEDKIGTIIHYKVVPFNFAGVEFDIASIDARTYQIQGTYFRPQVQAPLRTFVQSPGSFLTVQSESLNWIRKKNVIAGGSPVQVEWPDAARARGYGARGYGAGGYGRFESDTSSVNWRVEVLSLDAATVVRCTTVDTLAFNYSTDANSEDFNGWSGEFSIRVTPFNEFGDALRSRTQILELFE